LLEAGLNPTLPRELFWQLAYSWELLGLLAMFSVGLQNDEFIACSKDVNLVWLALADSS
jgi:hypothetical protein